MSEITRSEMTQEDALRLADELVGQALKETEARCRVVAEYISDCERAGSKSAAWSEAVRELSALHGRRRGLLGRRALIEQALACPVGESPAHVTLAPPSNRTAVRAQRQVQLQVRARRRTQD